MTCASLQSYFFILFWCIQGRPRSNSSLKVSAAEWKPSGPEQAAEKANDNEPSTEEDDWEKLAVDPVLPNTGEATEKPAEKPAPVDQPVDDWETQADPNVPISVPDVPTVTKDSKVDSNQVFIIFLKGISSPPIFFTNVKNMFMSKHGLQ